MVWANDFVFDPRPWKTLRTLRLPAHRRALLRDCLVTDAIEHDHAELNGWRAYLCGSPPMVEAATVVARDKGIAAEHIHADAFYTQGT